MKQLLILFFIFSLSFTGFSQIQPEKTLPTRDKKPGEQQIIKDVKPPIFDYKIISFKNDTTFVDTTLTIYKDYQFNYLRKDNFELLPFSNVGQTYNTLAYNFREERETPVPGFGARARHFNFMEVEDIFYYHVPTPLTELYFKTVFEQGQTLDAFFTANTSPSLNLSIAYKGNRSLGKYQHILTSTGNFRTTLNYQAPNGKYHLKTHFVSQDLLNEENGGLQPLALQQYIGEEEEFEDRSRLEVNFEDAESTLFGKRFYLNHSYDLVKKKDSLISNKLSVGHIMNYSYKKYQFEQATSSTMFGPSFEDINIKDETRLENIYNEATIGFSNSTLGTIKAKAAFARLNYGYGSRLILESGTIPNRIKDEILSVGGVYSKTIGGFDFYADALLNLSGEFKGQRYKAGLDVTLGNDNKASFSLTGSNRAPNFNFLLYQSDYVNYNWYNEFSNVVTHTLNFSVNFPRLLNVDADYVNIHNYTFFGIDAAEAVKPLQYSGEVNYFKIKGQRELSVGKFALENTVLYQKVLDGENVLNIPSFITRNSLYYRDHWFRRALYLQTGFTLKYFTNYKMNAYDPVLAEFYVQNESEMEGFPQVDFFFNGKIRQARIFFKLEHVNSLLTGNTNFAAPLHPYRDFGVRFGLVWNFFR